MNLPDKKRGPDFRAFLRRLDTFGRKVRHSMLPLHSTSGGPDVAVFSLESSCRPPELAPVSETS